MPSVRTADLADELLLAVGRLNRWASRHADLTVPPARLRLLALVDELGSARVGDLARADNTTQPTMTVQVDRLAAAGLLRRAADPKDGRAVLVELTDDGRTALSTARAARGTVIAPLVADLEPGARDDLRAAVRTLTALVAALPRTT
ncbi:MAG: MarR family transcriptional regulator [Nostocoides sp.]